MAVPFIRTAFSAGELTPSLWGHVDFAKFAIGASTLRNMFVSYRGGAYSRAGTKFVGFSKQTGRTVPPRMITFQFSINQGRALEFGNFYMRVIVDGAYVTAPFQNITAITQAADCTLTIPAHGYQIGEWVAIAGCQGMTQLNGQTYVIVGATTNTITIADVFGNVINSSAFGAYTGGGTAAEIYTLSTPWGEQDLDWLKLTQSADVMSICCWNQQSGTSYAAYDLARQADNSWTLTQINPQPTISAPAACSASPSSAGSTDFQYVVTAVNPVDRTESIASPIGDSPNSVDIASTLGSITVTWDAVNTVTEYKVYKATPVYNGTVPAGALFGYAGTSAGVQLVDDNITPDFTTTPPLYTNPFAPGSISSVDVTNNGSAIVGLGWTINTASGSGFAGYPILLGGGLFGFVVTNPGENYKSTDTITFTVSSGTPPRGTINVGPNSGTYPSVVTYFQQRRVYASSPNDPDTYWMSVPGSFTNFSTRTPTISSDAITGTPWSVEVNGIQFMIPMPGGLVVLTGLQAWQLTGTGGSSLNPQPITPSSQQAQPQGFNGCNPTVAPVQIAFDIIYIQAKGSIVRDLAYNFFVNIYTGTDLTVLSSHLFTGYTLTSTAWCEEPYKVIWYVRNDGILLSETFLKDQDVNAWGRHDTQGLFVSICNVVEPPVDALYCAVQRYTPQSIAANQNCYMVERMDNRLWETVEDVWAVDAALQLAQPEPNATLSADYAGGIGKLTGVTNLVGGANYSNATTAQVVDLNPLTGEATGLGSGAVPTLTIVAGVITAVTFAGGSQGSNYRYPKLIIEDPSGSGSGASANPVLDNTVTLTASAAIFSAGSVGQVIRAGGGCAVVTQYVSTTEVKGLMRTPMVQVIPNSGTTANPYGMPVPQPSGSWTMTTPVAQVTGLNHLIGMSVTGLYDGQVLTPTTVANDGSVTLPGGATASSITIGLGYTAQVQSLYLNEPGPSTIQGQRKSVKAVTVRAELSRSYQLGANQPDGSVQSPIQIAPPWSNMVNAPDAGQATYLPLAPYPYLAAGSLTPPLPLLTADQRAPVTGGFKKPGQVAVQQTNPLPLQVLALIPEVLPGDQAELKTESPARRQQQPQRRAA